LLLLKYWCTLSTYHVGAQDPDILIDALYPHIVRGIGVGLEGFHSSPIPDIPLMCFALYILFKGQRALHIAASNNNVEVAKFFLLNGANVYANDYDVSISVC
jgi:hypothetical protein